MIALARSLMMRRRVPERIGRSPRCRRRKSAGDPRRVGTHDSGRRSRGPAIRWKSELVKFFRKTAARINFSRMRLADARLDALWRIQHDQPLDRRTKHYAAVTAPFSRAGCREARRLQRVTGSGGPRTSSSRMERTATALSGVRCVVTAAGPYEMTGPAMRAACRTRCSYLDHQRGCR
jgi:hypothetical protein